MKVERKEVIHKKKKKGEMKELCFGKESFSVVEIPGLEPGRTKRRYLKPLRLPFPPYPEIYSVITTANRFSLR